MAFIFSFFAIRILLKFLEHKIGTGIIARITNTALGGLVGFALGMSVVLVFSFLWDLVEITSSNSFVLLLRESKIYNILEILRIKF